MKEKVFDFGFSNIQGFDLARFKVKETTEDLG